jgi:uncharacterized protein (DUF1810 family)
MTKLTDVELEKLNSIRKETSDLVTALGELCYQQLINENEMLKLKSRVVANAEEQKKLMESFTDKYGSGRLDVETGEISII